MAEVAVNIAGIEAVMGGVNITVTIVTEAEVVTMAVVMAGVGATEVIVVTNMIASEQAGEARKALGTRLGAFCFRYFTTGTKQ